MHCHSVSLRYSLTENSLQCSGTALFAVLCNDTGFAMLSRMQRSVTAFDLPKPPPTCEAEIIGRVLFHGSSSGSSEDSSLSDDPCCSPSTLFMNLIMSVSTRNRRTSVKYS